MAKVEMNTSLQELREQAIQAGAEQNAFFVSTLERYEVLVGNCKKLQRAFEDDGMLVTKEYVKGRGNVYVHPAVAEYNRTCQAANRTADTLMKMIQVFAEHRLEDSVREEEDEL